MPADRLSTATHAFLPGERSDPLGKTDSVAAGGGVSASERCLFARRAAGDPQFSKHSRFPMRYPADSIFKYSPAVPVKYSMEDISET